MRYHVIAEDQFVRACLYARWGGDREDEPLKLLEVNLGTVPAGVSPVYFGPTKEYPPAIIIEVTAEEYREVESGTFRSQRARTM